MTKITLKPNDQTYCGKLIRCDSWHANFFTKVLFVGEKYFFGLDSEGDEDQWLITLEYSLYEPPQKYVNKAPALVINPMAGRLVTTTYLFGSLEEAKREYPIQVIEWPACNSQGEPLWVRVPVKEGI